MNNEWYTFIKKYSKRTGDIAGHHLDDLTDLPYEVLKNKVLDCFDRGELEEAIVMILNNSGKSITLQEVRKLPQPEKELFLLWVNDQYQAIADTEKKYLSMPPDAKMLRAGIRELDILGDINVIDQIAKGKVWKWKKIRNLPYSMIFEKQLKMVIEKRIEKRLKDDRHN